MKHKLEVSGYDGYTTIVTGGSLRVTDEEISSGIYASTSGEPVALTVFDTYADYTAAGITGYSLSESDSADDGKYYVWLPVTP